jgi:ankyrin repeat protein
MRCLWPCAALLFVIALTPPPVEGRTKNGDEYLKEGAKAEQRQDYDAALKLYDYALEEDSREPAYVAADQRARGLFSKQLLTQGRELLQSNRWKLDEAKAQFRRALLIDPHSLSVQEEIRKIEEQFGSLQAPPILEPQAYLIKDLEMKNRSASVLYESIGKEAGIKAIFDSAGIDSPGAGTPNQPPHPSAIAVEDALNAVAIYTHTSWKAISRDTIYVTRDTEPQRSLAFYDMVLTRASAREQVSPSLHVAALAPGDALPAAVRAGMLAEIVRLVITGTDVNARDALGMAPLFYAVKVDKPAIVRFLLEHGADANTRLELQAKKQTDIPALDGQTALHAAVSHGNAEIVQLLLAAHSDPEALDANRNTPLDYAVAGGNPEIVRLLLAHGANGKRTRPLDGRGFLHEACARGLANLIPILVEFGADPAQRDRYGETPLDLALANENEAAVVALLRLGEQQKQLQVAAGEAMEDATVRGYTEIARILVENGVDVNKPTARGSTYLGDAALKGQKGMVQLLLDHGASIALRNKWGGTALHDAALGGSAEVIDLFLDRGAEIDVRNLDMGATPLMLAASVGRREAVLALLKRGANSQLRDASGHTALDRARETGTSEIIRLLTATLVHTNPV